MKTWWNKWQDNWRNFDVFNRIIVVNAFVFVIVSIFSISGLNAQFNLQNWLALPVNFSDLLYQPWSVFTYGFVHFDLWHFFFNMLVFYYLVQFYQNLVNPKLTLNVFFMGILAGAASFLFINYLLLQLSFPLQSGALIGASAGVRALLIFLAVYVANYRVRLFMFTVEMKYIGLAAVFFDFLGLIGSNSGGNLAHLGGDLLGGVYAYQLKQGFDIGKGFERLMSTLVGWFKFGQNKGFKKVYRRRASNTMAGHSKEDFQSFNQQKQIDLILDKISNSGYESLSQQEKDFLFRSGK